MEESGLSFRQILGNSDLFVNEERTKGECHGEKEQIYTSSLEQNLGLYNVLSHDGLLIAV